MEWEKKSKLIVCGFGFIPPVTGQRGKECNVTPLLRSDPDSYRDEKY